MCVTRRTTHSREEGNPRDCAAYLESFGLETRYLRQNCSPERSGDLQSSCAAKAALQWPSPASRRRRAEVAMRDLHVLGELAGHALPSGVLIRKRWSAHALVCRRLHLLSALRGVFGMSHSSLAGALQRDGCRQLHFEGSPETIASWAAPPA